MLDVTLSLDMKELNKLAILKGLRKALITGTQKAMHFAEAKSKARFDTPGNLKVQTGTLRRSIKGIVEEDVNRIKGILFTNIEYGGPHELGLMMRTRSGSTYMMPHRPFLSPSILENLEEIDEIIANTILKHLKR